MFTYFGNFKYNWANFHGCEYTNNKDKKPSDHTGLDLD